MTGEEDARAEAAISKRKASVGQRKQPAKSRKLKQSGFEGLPTSGDEADDFETVQQGRKLNKQMNRLEGRTEMSGRMEDSGSRVAPNDGLRQESGDTYSPTQSETRDAKKAELDAEIASIVQCGLNNPALPYGPRDIDFNDLEVVASRKEKLKILLDRMKQEPTLLTGPGGEPSKFYNTVDQYYDCLGVLCVLPVWRQKQHKAGKRRAQALEGRMADPGTENDMTPSIPHFELEDTAKAIFKTADVQKLSAVRNISYEYVGVADKWVAQGASELRELQWQNQAEAAAKLADGHESQELGQGQQAALEEARQKSHKTRNELQNEAWALEFFKVMFHGVRDVVKRKMTEMEAASKKATASKSAKKNAKKDAKKDAKKHANGTHGGDEAHQRKDT